MFVAREQNGCLYLHTFKPEYNRLTGEWSNHGYKTMIRVELFPKLKYYHQPVEVEIVEKKQKVYGGIDYEYSRTNNSRKFTGDSVWCPLEFETCNVCAK